jgi:hypothetical protein
METTAQTTLDTMPRFDLSPEAFADLQVMDRRDSGQAPTIVAATEYREVPVHEIQQVSCNLQQNYAAFYASAAYLDYQSRVMAQQRSESLNPEAKNNEDEDETSSKRPGHVRLNLLASILGFTASSSLSTNKK